MACCGQNRARFATRATSQADVPQSVAPISLRFVHQRAIYVRGPVTGKRYHFHDRDYTRGIDIRDTVEMLNSGYFEQEKE
jgi:hypothetical protein